jgi:acetyl esterase/lipase
MLIFNITRKLVFLSFIFLVNVQLHSQQFISLWPKDKMPNSKGIYVKDSVSDERYRQVGAPGMLAYFTSKQENKNVAVIICPGGGYKHYSYEVSGIQIAKWLNTMGINAFVLLSRLPHSSDLIERHKAPLQDAQRAIRLIRANAGIYGIDKNKVGIIGFSAGGHLASTLGTHTEDVSDIKDGLDTLSFKPDFMLLISPVISMGTYTHNGSRDNLLGPNPSQELIDAYSNELRVTDKTPPAFIAVADNDKGVHPYNSISFYQALHDKNIPASLFVFAQGGHNLALRNNPGSASNWPVLCESWLVEMGFLPSNKPSK